MSERMTDKEITLLEQSLFGGEGSTVHKARRLIEALKAERAEVARWQQRAEDKACAHSDMAVLYGAERKRAEAAEAKLRAVGELPGRWRDADLNRRYPTDAPSVEDCADELEALLKKNAPGPAGGE